jgi:hypothetical protein
VSKIKTKQEALPDKVVAEDQRLDAAFGKASQAAGVAQFERDRLRWEWTRCPNGPTIGVNEYARQVGRAQSTISQSLAAYEMSSMQRSVTDRSIECSYNHEAYNTTAPAPTEKQAKAHADAKHKVALGDVRAAIVASIASLWGVTENTVHGNSTYTPFKDSILRRVQAEVRVDDLDESEAKQAIHSIAWEVHAEWKHDEARMQRAKKWMAENRALNVSEVSTGDARKKVEHIHEQAAKAAISYEAAEAAAREFDRKFVEHERIQNERLRAARHAVQELSKAAADLHAVALRVVRAVQSIESDGIEMSADERAVFGNDIEKAEAAVRMARAALMGDSGTDWDAALEALTGGAK